MIAALSLGCGSTLGGRAQGAGEGFAPAQVGERLTIQTASATVVVDDLRPSVAEAQTLARAAGGSITSSRVDENSATVHARVPAAALQSFLDSIAELGEETARSTTTEDVTDAYSDLEAEISNLQALRDRLRALLDRASTVEEVLQVERELTRVQTKLDSMEGRRQRMATDVRLSAVTLLLMERPPPVILGPLGLLLKGTRWFLTKLFVISP